MHCLSICIPLIENVALGSDFEQFIGCTSILNVSGSWQCRVVQLLLSSKMNGVLFFCNLIGPYCRSFAWSAIGLVWSEILKFWLFERTRYFKKIKLSRTKSDIFGLFSVGKAWLSHNIVWAAYSIPVSSDESPWPWGCREYCKDFTVALEMFDVFKESNVPLFNRWEKICFWRLELYYNYIDVSQEFNILFCVWLCMLCMCMF